MTPSSQEMEPPENPNRFNLWRAHTLETLRDRHAILEMCRVAAVKRVKVTLQRIFGTRDCRASPGEGTAVSARASHAGLGSRPRSRAMTIIAKPSR
jgi:hypothetical protein